MIFKLKTLFDLLKETVPLLLISLPIFLLITFIYISFKEKKLVTIKNKEFYILKLLNFIYVKNIWFKLIQLIIYFMMTIGLIILFRIANFGKCYNIWDLFIHKAKFSSNFVTIMILIILMFFHIKFLTILLKDTFYTIHVYFYSNKIYYKFIDYLWSKGNSTFSIIAKTSLFLTYSLENKERPHYSNNVIAFKKYLKKKDSFKISLSKIDEYITKYYHFCWAEECFYLYLPHILVYSVLIYDLRNNEIRYFYFVILLFFVINIYRRLKNFIGQLDFYEIDKVLHYYFYKTDVHNKLMLAKTHKQRFELLSKDGYGWDTYNDYEDKIIAYIKRDYIVDYVDIEFKKSYEPYSVRIFYFTIFISYMIFCYNLSIINCILITIPLILAIISYEYCFYVYKNKQKYIMKYLFAYIILFGISILILIWIYLTRHTLYFMNDLIWNYKFNIMQTFSLQEKILYLKQYLMFKIQPLTINKQLYLLKILKTIPFQELLETKTINEIKVYIDNIIETYSYLETKIYPEMISELRGQAMETGSKYKSIIRFLKALINIKF